MREHDTGKLIGAAPLALGVTLAARGRPAEALPLTERGVALSRTFGQPIQLANALLSQAPVLRALGEHQRAADAIAEARSSSNPARIRGSWPGGWALGRPPQIHRVRSGDQELTQQELRVLKLLHGDLSERDIGRELYVSHSTVHSHVRAIYRKLGVCSRADALERGRQLGLLWRLRPVAETRSREGAAGDIYVKATRPVLSCSGIHRERCPHRLFFVSAPDTARAAPYRRENSGWSRP